ncbi:hypothetical protein FACS189413_11370 [Bacteroidia bacterium]|nr:hypothetical protein FACS189463_1620 [Bacteroidia bacterium]GHU70690.1 hypothetical protein FACS189413_11370 [Bacteroidia bacterium]
MKIMKKSFIWLFVALLSSVSLFAENIPAGTKLYLTPNANWKTADARFAAYFFLEGAENTIWVDFITTEETDLYEVTTPEGTWDHVIFCRMNPSTAENKWDNRWNQTKDLLYDGTNNHYTVAAGAWSNGDGVWSIYGTVVSTPSITLTVPAQVFIDETITLEANAVNVNNPVITYSVKIPGNDLFITTTSPYQPAIVGVYTFKVEVTESGNATILASDEKEVIVKEVPSPITIKVKVPVEWTTVSFYYWTIGDGQFVTPTLNGDFYAYTFNREESVNLIFVNGTEWDTTTPDSEEAAKAKWGKQTINITGITESTCYEITDATYNEGDSDWGKKRVNVADCTVTAISAIAYNDNVIVENNVIRALFEGSAKVELYTVGGQLVRSVTAVNGFSQKVQSGAYLLRMNGKTQKLVVR